MDDKTLRVLQALMQMQQPPNPIEAYNQRLQMGPLDQNAQDPLKSLSSEMNADFRNMFGMALPIDLRTEDAFQQLRRDELRQFRNR